MITSLLLKKIYGGTDSDDKHLEEMLRKTSVLAKKNLRETRFDGDYNSIKTLL